MKVLITGAGGFIGSHLVESQLSRGHMVRAVDLNLDRLAHLSGNKSLEAVTGDIVDKELVRNIVEGINIVYHLASAHLDVTLPDNVYHQVNVEASVNLATAAHAAGVGRMVHCSTNSVIGVMKNPPVDETASCQPTNIYEETKLLGEAAVLAYGRDNKFPIVVVRPAWVYGPGCPRTAKLFRTIQRRRFIMFGDGQTLRHPLYIADAIRGFEQCAESDGATGEIFFIAGEKPVTISELVRMIAEKQGVHAPLLKFPLWLGILASHLLEAVFIPFGRQPPVSRRSLDFYIKHNAYLIDKARRRLSFSPQISLPDGIEKTITAMKMA